MNYLLVVQVFVRTPRYDKLDVVYVTFVSMALICEHLR